MSSVFLIYLFLISLVVLFLLLSLSTLKRRAFLGIQNWIFWRGISARNDLFVNKKNLIFNSPGTKTPQPPGRASSYASDCLMLRRQQADGVASTRRPLLRVASRASDPTPSLLRHSSRLTPPALAGGPPVGLTPIRWDSTHSQTIEHLILHGNSL